MRKLICLIVICLLFFEAIPALAVEGSEVQLRATTVPGAKIGAVGEFEITLPDRMVFRAAGAPELAMPYASIVEFSSREEVKYHIGVLPAIVVGLLKSRHKLHFITISYRDQNDVMQVASFEVSKTAPGILVSVLQSRARNACERREFGACTPVTAPPRQHLP